jgi:glycosyltransferase involved in cell wall biosynthesis
MRILFVTQWFDPEPIFKGLAFARELKRYGHDVQVLTGFPNYPGGRLYEGYRIRPVQRECIDGVSVVRVPLYPSHSRSVAGRTLNYCSFAASAATIGTAIVGRPDVIYAYHPPATVGIPAVTLRAVYGAPLVYDIQDLWPDSVAASGMITSRRRLGLLSTLCRFVYARTDHITVLSPGLKQALIARGVPPEKVTVVYNWCDEAQIIQRGSSAAHQPADGWPGKFLVVFAGTMGAAQALDSALEAARLVGASRPDVHFLFIGGGIESERLAARALSLNLANVTFLPPVPVASIGRYLARADALLVHLKNDPLFEITIPSKTQAYMAAGRPLVMAVRGDAADLVRRANCGITCEPEDPGSLSRAIQSLAATGPVERRVLGENGRRFYENSCSLSAGTQKFDAIFRSLCSSGQVVRSSPARSSNS